ncbi:MAG: OmpA family protein [Acetobacteraceae bacterium]|nr:OmpA family protein [Acetobacteraceae bacterium]
MRRVAVLLLLLCASLGSASAARPAPQKYVVFFQDWSAALDDAAQAVISKAADAAKAQSALIVRVVGFASPAGSRATNVLLSDLRAQHVVDTLQEDGVARSRIRQRGHGPVRIALNAQEGRRVEITIGGR